MESLESPNFPKVPTGVDRVQEVNRLTLRGASDKAVCEFPTIILHPQHLHRLDREVQYLLHKRALGATAFYQETSQTVRVFTEIHVEIAIIEPKNVPVSKCTVSRLAVLKRSQDRQAQRLRRSIPQPRNLFHRFSIKNN